MNKFFYTYMIYINNPKSKFYGHIYYGQHTTTNLLDGYKGSGKLIHNYYKKYPNDYYFKILNFYNSQEELNKAEYELIHPHLGKEYCLNLVEGGSFGSLHPDVIKRVSEKNRGKKRGPKQLKNIQEGWVKGHNEETFKKQSESLKKYYENPVNRENNSQRIKKKWEDPEYRKKVCEGHTRVITQEELEKRSKSLKGKNKGKHKVWDNKELNIYHMEY